MAAKLSREKRASPHQQVEQNEEWLEVKRALDTLSPEKRVVVVLYYINDLSLQEIAGTLDLPIGTVKSRLYYGRSALKKQLSLHWDQEMLPDVRGAL